MLFRSKLNLQNVATSIIAAIIVGACVFIFPHPQNPIVCIFLLITIVISLSWGLFSIQFPYTIIQNRGTHFNLTVVFPSLIIMIILLSIGNVNNTLKSYLTSDVAYTLVIAVFAVLFIRETVPSFRLKDSTAIAATCIPVKYDEDKKIYFVTLVCNPNYQNEQWMFPGGHVHFYDGNYPPDVARSKARDEAGVEVELLCSSDVVDSPFIGIDHIKSPNFNFVFTLNDTARCKRAEGHEYHYDFTYLGVVKKILDVKPVNETITLEFKTTSPSEDEIRNELEKRIREFYQSRHERVPSDRFYPKSIPIMLLKALPLFPKKVI